MLKISKLLSEQYQTSITITTQFKVNPINTVLSFHNLYMGIYSSFIWEKFAMTIYPDKINMFAFLCSLKTTAENGLTTKNF